MVFARNKFDVLKKSPELAKIHLATVWESVPTILSQNKGAWFQLWSVLYDCIIITSLCLFGVPFSAQTNKYQFVLSTPCSCIRWLLCGAPAAWSLLLVPRPAGWGQEVLWQCASKVWAICTPPLIFNGCHSSTGIQHDQYTAPAACMYLGLLLMEEGDYEAASKKLETAR